MRGCARNLGQVHDDAAELEELVRRHRLGKEVGRVVVGAHKRNPHLARLDHVADEEVAALDVLRASVELRVVREVARGLAVGGSGGRPFHVGRVDTAQLLAVVDDVLGALREGDDLCLA